MQSLKKIHAWAQMKVPLIHISVNRESSSAVYIVCGRVPWLYQYWPEGFMIFVVLCP